MTQTKLGELFLDVMRYLRLALGTNSCGSTLGELSGKNET